MVFSSLVFLLIFLPILLIIYFLVKNIKAKNIILLLFSLFFYAWGEPIYIILMLFSITITFFFGIIINKNKGHNKVLLIIGIASLLSFLLFFKYYNFILDIINNILGISISKTTISLPIGISFYTFQAISYLCDIYSNKTKAQKNILNLALYISLFPQLIAGPIVRYETIEKDICNREHTLENVVLGLKRFIIGLSKKVILANSMAVIADTIIESGNYGTSLIYVGAISYALQIYYDFSGYSDMAIGLGKVFGFSLLENFNYPYISKTITDFWRRWHISLSSWFKDYVYIPLGGSRVKKWKHIRNILIVWILTGLWHGANYNFLIWGLYYGLLLVLEKYVFKKIIPKIPSSISHFITLFLIIIGWVIFRISDLNILSTTLKYMFVYQSSNWSSFLINNSDLLIDFYLIIPAIVFCFPIKKIIPKKESFIYSFIINLIYIALFIINLAILTSNTYNPFIYFRF